MSFQNPGASAAAFNSASRLRAASGSKSPPQEGERVANLLGDLFGFGAHRRLLARRGFGEAAIRGGNVHHRALADFGAPNLVA